ncbi:ATP synthase subunit f, mitochondrial-like [Artibeus jamaicensis]|uniref:ATP synthase subunit f, mitochondrial-like n=1 Tax=Artibeus jamaicensis TaxID=9417 RepID=UPI00235A641B|nr:ATP synthase subunit f, mitochondrial-like [Artibeus jamaicensis]
MASVVPLKGKRPVDVKLGELPGWILMRDFPPGGIAGAFQGGCYWYYKCVSVKKGNVAGVSMVLAAYELFNYCCSYKDPKHDPYLCTAPLNLFMLESTPNKRLNHRL